MTLTIDQVREILLDRGYKLLSNKVTGCNSIIDAQCIKHQITFHRSIRDFTQKRDPPPCTLCKVEKKSKEKSPRDTSI